MIYLLILILLLFLFDLESSILLIIYIFSLCIITYMVCNIPLFRYSNNKKINKKNTSYYRDIPCDKNIFFAYVLLDLNGWIVRKSNIMGALFLKWINDGIIVVMNNNDNISLYFNSSALIKNKEEYEIYDVIYNASRNGILEKGELEDWIHKNKNKLYFLIQKIQMDILRFLIKENYVSLRKNKRRYVMDDRLYDESKKLYGLKLYLDDFSKIDDRKAIEVKLWNEYLMFACIFGVASKVNKEFERLCPKTIEYSDSDSVIASWVFAMFENLSVKSKLSSKMINKL